MIAFEYFDTERLYKEVESKAQGDVANIIMSYEETGFSHRWIQPPVVCYFVTSLDEFGNVDMSAISMGTAMWGEPPDGKWFFTFDVQNSRQTQKNIDLNKECVISFYPFKLIRESWIAGLPVPRGISELDLARLTPLPSRKVKPCGVAECVSNLECKVVHQVAISNSTIFIAEVVGVHVNKAAMEADRKMKHEPGMVMTDLLYEVSINGTPPRLNYSRMCLDSIYETDRDLGSDKVWIGPFVSWMESEKRRGKISDQELRTVLELNEKWNANMDPETNKETKKKLTTLLADIVWR